MSNPTPNLNLPSPIGSEYVGRAYFVELVNSIDGNAASKAALEALRNQLSESSGFGTAQQPIANKYTLTLNPAPTKYTLNMRLTVKIPSSNTGPATINVNNLGEKTIKRSNGTDLVFGTMKAGGVYALVYDGVNFTLLGEGGEYGSATADHVLAPHTIGTDNGLVTGTIPTRGNEFKSGTWSNGNADSHVDAEATLDGGYYPPGTKVTTQIQSWDLAPVNIRSGFEIFGVKGSPNTIETSLDTRETPTPSDLLQGKYAYANGKTIVGGLPDKSNQILPTVPIIYPSGPPSVTVSIPETGKYATTSGVRVDVPTLIPSNIKSGVEILGVMGTAGGGIIRVQGGTANFTSVNTVSATIPNAVNLNNAVLLFTVHCTSNQPWHHKVSGKLVSNQIVSFYQNKPTGKSFTCTVRYQVIEFQPGVVKQIIRGQADRITGNATKSVSLPAPGVDTNKTWLIGSYSTNLADPNGYADAYVGFGSGGRELLLLGHLFSDPNPAIFYTEKWEYQVVEFN